MKEQFTNALLKALILEKDYMPAQDENGNLRLEGAVNILVGNSFGSFMVLELLDGDRFSADEIRARLEQNERILSGLEAGAAQYFVDVFLFDHAPQQDKLQAIESGQTQKTMRKKFLKCLGIDLSSGTMTRYYRTPVGDFGIGRVVREILAKGVPGEMTDIGELARKRAEEHRLEYKAGAPVVTYGLIALNILIAGLLYLYSMQSGTSYEELLHQFGAKMNVNILQGEYWRFFTPVFLHANLVHLAINCYSLYAVGASVEKIFGKARFLAVYFTAGILGNLLSFAFSPNSSVGASGAIFGLLGALLYFGLEKPVLFKRAFGYNVLVTIFINLVYGFSKSGIDNYAHIGGLIGGFLASGTVAAARLKRWYTNRFLHAALAAVIACAVLLYGFNSTQNRIVLRISELEKLDQAQNWEKAETLAEDILDMKPGGTDTKSSVLWTLSKAEIMSGKYDEAVVHAKSLADLDPINGHYMLGIVYTNKQEYDLAKQEFQAAKDAGASGGQLEQIEEILGGVQ
jgi:rhomboid protease GluP